MMDKVGDESLKSDGIAKDRKKIEKVDALS